MIWYVLAAVILVISLLFRLGLLAYALYTLFTIFWVSRWLTKRWSESLSATRQCNRLSAEVGDTVAVIIEVHNESSFPIPWVLVEDLLPRDALLHQPPNLRVKGRRVLLTSIAGRGRERILYQLQCNRRGYYQLGPVVLETGDLFGLHRRYRVLTRPHFLLVRPKIISLEGYDISSKRPIGEVRMTYRLFEDPTRIAGVRQYEAGDPMNRVHWRATARTGTLHSKVYEPSTVAGLTLLLDFHQASHPQKDEPFRSELAVTTAASLIHAVYEMGQQIGLMTNGRDAADRIRHEGWAYDQRTREAAREGAGMLPKSERLRPVIVPTRRGPETFMQILDALGRLELTDGLTFSQLIEESQEHLPRDATVVVLLPQVTAEDAIRLSMLKRQGFAVTAVLNLYDQYEFGRAAGMLLAEGIESRQLRDEASIVSLCNQAVLR